jgi:hypothetical protein
MGSTFQVVVVAFATALLAELMVIPPVLQMIVATTKLQEIVPQRDDCAR